MNGDSAERMSVSDALEEMSATEFNDRILSLPIFACNKCSNFLSPPIMLVTGVGNVCGACNTQIAIHNSALELILQNLAIPCRNTARGCKERVDYFNIVGHNSVCSYRSYCCPLKQFEGCSWEGSSSNLLEHSLEKHPQFVVGGNGYCFRLEMDISTTNDVIKLLYANGDKFILRARCDVKALTLQYAVYFLGNVDKLPELTYTIEQTNCVGINSCLLRHASNSIILHDAELVKNFDPNQAVTIDLSLVKQLVRKPVVDTLIKISSGDIQQEELDDKLLSFFECAVCNHFMKPPIYQCLAGHSLCNRCRPQLSLCPTCRAGFGNTRNYALEALSSNVRFPCIYRDQGCHVVLPVSEISQHEVECSLRSYSCPFLETNRCTWEGTHADIAEHLQSYHADKTIFNSSHKTSIEFRFETTFHDLYCMITQGQVFRVCYKRDMGNQNTYWAVQLVGPRGEAKKYKCIVGLVDSRNENRRLIRIDLCQDITNRDNMFNQCIMIPSTVVSWFTSNGQITYYCKIKKVA